MDEGNVTSKRLRVSSSSLSVYSISLCLNENDFLSLSVPKVGEGEMARKFGETVVRLCQGIMVNMT